MRYPLKQPFHIEAGRHAQSGGQRSFADYNNDGRDDLWVGSVGSGNICV